MLSITRIEAEFLRELLVQLRDDPTWMVNELDEGLEIIQGVLEGEDYTIEQYLAVQCRAAGVRSD